MASNSHVAPVSASDSGALFAIRPGEITQAPTRLQSLVDAAFRRLSFLFACCTILLVTFIVLPHRGLGIARDASRRTLLPQRAGLGLRTPGGTESQAEIWGTLYTSILALVIGTAFGLAAAVFLSEGYMGQAIFAILRSFNLHLHPFWSEVPDKIEDLLKQLIELLAAIPSVVYGLWGLFVVIPLIRPACNWLHLEAGMDPIVLHRLERPRRAAGGARAGHHDSADDHGHQPRRARSRCRRSCAWPLMAWERHGGRQSLA